MPTWTAVVLFLPLASAGILGLLYWSLPWTVQPLLRALLWLRYDVVVVGVENVPSEGPTLILTNHVSWLDGFLIAGYTPRRGKALVNAAIVNRPLLRQLALRSGIIPTPWQGPRAIRAALQAGSAALDAGYAVAIFPEGQISRSGMLGPFQRGLEVMLRGREHTAVVPAGLDNLWGSFFTRSGGHFFRKWPRGWRRRVVLVFGPPLVAPVTAFAARQAVLEAMVIARRITGVPSHELETIDLTLPHWRHPELGLLAASTADVRIPEASVFQEGHREGTVGSAVPGMAVRVVDGEGQPLPPDSLGNLQAFTPASPGWVDTGVRGRIDRDGFIHLAPSAD